VWSLRGALSPAAAFGAGFAGTIHDTTQIQATPRSSTTGRKVLMVRNGGHWSIGV
jgi:hypothetical protein